jgi:hypothetical protein
VPRFFINIRCSDYQVDDLVGGECADLDQLREQAEQTARALVRATKLRGGSPEEGWIEVEDEDHRPLLVLPLKNVIS